MTKAEELKRLYELAQKRLVEIITTKSARGSPALYERRILKQITAELKKLKKATPELVKQLVLEGYTTGLEDAVQDILKAGMPKPAYNLFPASTQSKSISLCKIRLTASIRLQTSSAGAWKMKYARPACVRHP